MKAHNPQSELISLLSQYLSKKDVYAIQIKTELSSMIMNFRYEKNMNQTQFAEYMGVTQAMVSKWESGEYNFSVEAISEICAKLSMVPAIEFKSENEYQREYMRKKNKETEWNQGRLFKKNNLNLSLAS